MITCLYYNMPASQLAGIDEVVTVQDSDGNPINLSGAAVTFYARQSEDPDSLQIFEIHVGTGITITDGPNGIFHILADGATLHFDDDLVFGLPTDSMVSIPYWVFVTPSGGTQFALLRGPLTILRS